MAQRPSVDLRIVASGKEHDRGSFTRAVESLDRYLKTQAGQDVRATLDQETLMERVRRLTRGWASA